MQIELDQSKVSPQTHVFLGMYRPPWEQMLESKRRQISEGIEATRKEMGYVLPDQPRYAEFDNCFQEKGLYSTDSHLRQDYLAGHFDIPQYRLIENRKAQNAASGSRDSISKIARRLRSFSTCLRGDVECLKPKVLKIVKALEDFNKQHTATE